MSVMDFCFENADTKGRNLDYVLWLGMVMSALMLLSRIYLRRLSSSSRDTASQPKFVVCVKKILKEFSEFCNTVVYFMICYSCYEVSSFWSIFSIFCIPTFMYKEMRKWYSLISFEVNEIFGLPLSWEIRLPCEHLCGK